jgi:hypothetical protein
VIVSFEDCNEPSVPTKEGNFMTNRVTVTFSRKPLDHGIISLYVQSQFRISSQVFKMYKIQKVYYTNQHRFSYNINAFMTLTSLLWASPQ